MTAISESALPGRLQDVQARRARHPDVGQDHVVSTLRKKLESLLAPVGDGGLEPFAFEEDSQRVQDAGFVIDDEHANGLLVHRVGLLERQFMSEPQGLGVGCRVSSRLMCGVSGQVNGEASPAQIGSIDRHGSLVGFDGSMDHGETEAATPRPGPSRRDRRSAHGPLRELRARSHRP